MTCMRRSIVYWSLLAIGAFGTTGLSYWYLARRAASEPQIARVEIPNKFQITPERRSRHDDTGAGRFSKRDDLQRDIGKLGRRSSPPLLPFLNIPVLGLVTATDGLPAHSR